jgi:hypothetical protein
MGREVPGEGDLYILRYSRKAKEGLTRVIYPDTVFPFLNGVAIEKSGPA